MTPAKPRSWWIDFSADVSTGENPVLDYKPEYAGADAIHVLEATPATLHAEELCEALESQVRTLAIVLEFFATRPFVPSRQVWADQYADDMRAERNEMLTLLARATEGK